ncbi:hypothetical protein GPALN_011574 [Globodera pallida]|nr:hypothetical protein GPALN_011574 [Globodera pallida]
MGFLGRMCKQNLIISIPSRHFLSIPHLLEAICLLIVSNTLPSATSSALADQCQHTSRSGGDGGSDSVCSSISNSSNSYHSAKSCGGTARCCPHCCASSVSSSPSASPSSSSAERLSPTGHSEAVVVVVDSESPKSDCSSSSGSSSSSSVIITNCTLCRQHRTPPPAAIEQHSRVGSEETLKRADSRLTIPRGSQSSSRSSDESQRKRPLSQRQQQQQLQQQFGEVDKLNAIVGAAAKSCSCEECVLARQREQLQQQHDQQQQHAAGLSAGVGVSHRSSGGGGGIAGQLSIALANAQLASGPTTSSSSGTSAQQQQQQMMYCNGPSTTQTIEEQIKQIDRISKECDNSRKSLEIINRRLDDLNDEVRRYREFLGHEKARRDPALYKTSNAEPLSSYNDSICRLIDSLTTQLTMEWTEKLRSIQNQTVAKFASGERG